MLFEGADDLIKSVKFVLDPTFSPPQVIVNKSPFNLRRLGWGTFEVELVITFRDNFNLPPLKLYHELVFEGDGHFSAHVLQLNGL